MRIGDSTYLQAGARRMALLLLGPINSRSLAAGALAARGLALSASHCCCDEMHADARGDGAEKGRNKGLLVKCPCVMCGRDANDASLGNSRRCGGGWG